MVMLSSFGFDSLLSTSFPLWLEGKKDHSETKFNFTKLTSPNPFSKRFWTFDASKALDCFLYGQRRKWFSFDRCSRGDSSSSVTRFWLDCVRVYGFVWQYQRRQQTRIDDRNLLTHSCLMSKWTWFTKIFLCLVERFLHFSTSPPLGLVSSDDRSHFEPQFMITKRSLRRWLEESSEKFPFQAAFYNRRRWGSDDERSFDDDTTRTIDRWSRTKASFMVEIVFVDAWWWPRSNDELVLLWLLWIIPLLWLKRKNYMILYLNNTINDDTLIQWKMVKKCEYLPFYYCQTKLLAIYHR